MPVGFACTSQTAISVADEVLKQSYKNGFDLYFDKARNSTIGTNKPLTCTREQLLNPSKFIPDAFDYSSPYEIIVDEDRSYKNSKKDFCFEFIKGNFRLNMFYHLIWKDGEKNKCAKNAIGTNQNFTLMCRLYKGFTFHPLTIKERIINTFDYETYNLWRQNILESMDDMRVLIYVARKVLTQFNFPILYSSVSCPSSKRFCESSGLFVHRGVAFMMPLKFEY